MKLHFRFAELSRIILNLTPETNYSRFSYGFRKDAPPLPVHIKTQRTSVDEVTYFLKYLLI